MAYVTASDIQAEFRGITFSTTTTPTAVAVAEFIAQEEAMLNGKLSKKYAVPVTGTEAVKVAKLIATLYVKSRIQDMLAVKTGDPKVDQGSGGTALRTRADELVESIMNDQMKLSDATLAESNNGVGDYVSDKLSTTDQTTSANNLVTRTFRRDSIAW